MAKSNEFFKRGLTLIAGLLLLCVSWVNVSAQEKISHNGITGLRFKDLSYKTGDTLNTYERERCNLDIYMPDLPVGSFPVIVYFHGGGLVEGDKSEGWANWSNNFGYQFLRNGIGLVMVNYRLSGKNGTKWPDYLRDAAASVVWVSKNIRAYGGNPKSLFVSGFSAGGYITHMLSIDPTWFKELGFNPRQIRGYIPMSGQTRQHANLAKDLGVPQTEMLSLRPDAMPLALAHKTQVPIYISTGGNEGQTIIDNQVYHFLLSKLGSKNVYFYTQPNKGHVEMRDALGDDVSPNRDRIIDFVMKYK